VPLELVQQVNGAQNDGRRAEALLPTGPRGIPAGVECGHAEVADQREPGDRGQRAENRGQGKAPKDEIREIMEAATAKTWKRDQARIAELLGKI
jgi:hypothetical protein